MIPHVLAVMTWPTAQLEATVLNVAGGKPDPDEEKPADAKPFKPELLFRASELLMPWARLVGADAATLAATEGKGTTARLNELWTPLSAAVALNFSRYVAPWARPLIPHAALKGLADQV